jgi:hypothetical protein
VHVDAVGAAVELRGPQPEQVAQPGVDAGPVELLRGGVVEVRERDTLAALLAKLDASLDSA